MKLLSALFSLTCLFFIGCGGNNSSSPTTDIRMHNLTLSNNESSNVRPLKTSLDMEARANFESLDGGRNVLVLLAFDDNRALDTTRLTMQLEKAPIAEGTVIDFSTPFRALDLKYRNDIVSNPAGDGYTARAWTATSGQIVVEELTEAYVTVRYTNVRFVFDPLEDTEGRPNDAEGEFTLNGTVRLPINYS